MTDKKKLPTINLKGKEYVQVKDRLSYFNETYPNGALVTEVIATDKNMITFKATITPDVALPTRVFIGHSFGGIEEVKAFEKLETVAVGRALAFMGIGVIESIASADEMDRFHSKDGFYKEPTYKVRSKVDSVQTPEGELFTGTKNGRKYYGLKQLDGTTKWLQTEAEYKALLPKVDGKLDPLTF